MHQQLENSTKLEHLLRKTFKIFDIFFEQKEEIRTHTVKNIKDFPTLLFDIFFDQKEEIRTHIETHVSQKNLIYWSHFFFLLFSEGMLIPSHPTLIWVPCFRKKQAKIELWGLR